jgi:hypothetical protein
MIHFEEWRLVLKAARWSPLTGSKSSALNASQRRLISAANEKQAESVRTITSPYFIPLSPLNPFAQ